LKSIVFYLRRQFGERRLKLTWNLNFLEVILIFIIIFEIGFVFFESSLRPAINYDTLATWGWKAKVFFYQPKEAFTPNSNLFLGGGGHQNYPLHIPILMTWVYLWLAEVNDVAVNLIFALCFVGLIGFVYLSLRKEIGRQKSLIFTMFLATLPLLDYHGFNAYADLPLAFYFTLAAIFLFRYFKNRQTPDLILAGILAGLTTWVKNEGLMLAGVLMIVLFIHLIREKMVKNEVKRFLFSVFCFLIFFLPWFIFKKFFGLGYGLNTATNFQLSGFHPEILPKILEQLFIFHSFHLWPGIFLIILGMRIACLRPYRRLADRTSTTRTGTSECALRVLFLIVFGALAGFLFIYLFSPAYEFAVNGMASSRNLLVIMPLTIFLAAYLFRSD